MRHRRGYLRGGTAAEFDRLVGVQDLHRQRALVGRRLVSQPTAREQFGREPFFRELLEG